MKPDAVVVFYPTRYDVEKVAAELECPMVGIFAEKDDIPGATKDDAVKLQGMLAKNPNVPD